MPERPCHGSALRVFVEGSRPQATRAERRLYRLAPTEAEGDGQRPDRWGELGCTTSCGHGGTAPCGQQTPGPAARWLMARRGPVPRQEQSSRTTLTGQPARPLRADPAHGRCIFRRATELVCGALRTMGDHTDTWKPRKRSYINVGAKNVLHGNTTFSISN